MLKSPLISVIVPLYNKQSTVKNSIDSVLRQSFFDFELIIVDDGSSDKSLEVISSFNDARIRVFRKVNGGVSSARNFGVSRSAGRWIYFLDADDIMYDDCLLIFNGLIYSFPERAVYMANWHNETRDGDLKLAFQTISDKTQERLVNSRSLWNGSLSSRTGSTLISKDFFLELGGFNEKISYYEDLDFTLRFIDRVHIVISPVPVMLHVRDSNGLSFARRRPLDKDFIYYASFTGHRFYSKLIIGGILANNLKYYFKYRQWNSVRWLINRYCLDFFYVFIAVLLRRLNRK